MRVDCQNVGFSMSIWMVCANVCSRQIAERVSPFRALIPHATPRFRTVLSIAIACRWPRAYPNHGGENRMSSPIPPGSTLFFWCSFLGPFQSNPSFCLVDLPSAHARTCGFYGAIFRSVSSRCFWRAFDRSGTDLTHVFDRRHVKLIVCARR